MLLAAHTHPGLHHHTQSGVPRSQGLTTSSGRANTVSASQWNSPAATAAAGDTPPAPPLPPLLLVLGARAGGMRLPVTAVNKVPAPPRPLPLLLLVLLEGAPPAPLLVEVLHSGSSSAQAAAASGCAR